jgi:EAL domain-containing protein (putative c-di-GMP-specific phosphodiesterase class I)
VVEGVTSSGELDLLRDMGHRFLQGFVFSRPLEAAQLVAGDWRRCAGHGSRAVAAGAA